MKHTGEKRDDVMKKEMKLLSGQRKEEEEEKDEEEEKEKEEEEKEEEEEEENKKSSVLPSFERTASFSSPTGDLRQCLENVMSALNCTNSGSNEIPRACFPKKSVFWLFSIIKYIYIYISSISYIYIKLFHWNKLFFFFFFF